MSLVWKLCVGGVAGIALVGAAWWSWEPASVVPLRTDAAAPQLVEHPSTPAETFEAREEEASREANAEASPAVALEAPPLEAASPDPTPLPPGGVDVRFVDPSGVPQVGVRVDCPDDGSGAVASSGPDGRAELTSDAWRQDRARPIEARAQLAGCAMVVLRTTVRGGELTHLGDVVLVPGVTLRGRVVDPTGTGIEGARVGVVPPDLEHGVKRAPDEERMRRHGTEAFGRHAFAESGRNGAFAIEGVAPGSWRLWGHEEDMRYAWTEPFEVASGLDENGLELVLEPLRTTDRIEGRILDPAGDPVSNATVLILYQGEQEGGGYSVSTDEEGRFRIVVQVGGTYRLMANDRERRFADGAVFGLRPGDLDVVVSLPEKRWVEVRAKDAAGEPVSGLFVEANGIDLAWSRAWIPESPSELVVRIDPPGFPFSLGVRADGRREVRLGPFDPSTMDERIEVEFECLPRIRGIVRVGDGPFAGARVQVVRERAEGRRGEGRRTKNGFAMRMDTQVTAESATREDGGFEVGLELAPSEQIFVRVLAQGWATVELGPTSVANATQARLDIELTRGGTIEGRVLRPDGRDGAGVIVGVHCGDGDARTQRAGPGGAYRFDLLKPGSWQVLVCEQEILASSTWTGSEDTGTPIEWNCVVFADRATTFDLSIDR